MILRQMRIVGLAVERELQHEHPGQPETIPQSPHLVRDDAEVLRDERRLAKAFPQRREQAIADAVPPHARAGRRCTGRHLPIRLERAEVIDAHEIEPP